MRRSHAPNRDRPARPGVADRLVLVAGLLLMPVPAFATTSPPAEPPPVSVPSQADAPQNPPTTAPESPTPDTVEPDPGDAPPQAPATEPPAAEPAAVDRADLEQLQATSRELQDELFKARARVAVVTSKLFRAKIALQLRSNLERFYEVSDLVISLDGAPVFVQDKGWPTAADDLFEAYAAPGAHELTISARLVARRDATYKLRIDDTFTVLVPPDSTVFTRLVLRETGNMWRFTKRGRGRHVLTAILRARAKPNERRRGAKAKASASTGAPGR